LEGNRQRTEFGSRRELLCALNVNLRFHATAKQYDVIGVTEPAENESSDPR
jgi:hypothetical protein